MNTHILIGIKDVNASGGFHGAEGFETFSIQGTKVTVIKEGSEKHLIRFIERERNLAKEGKEELKKLEDIADEYENYDEYLEKWSEINKKCFIDQFDKLIIIQGIVI